MRDFNRYFDALLNVALGEAGLQCRRISSEKSSSDVEFSSWSKMINGLSSKGIKPHLLVVAPSNVAVDNIIEKIIEKGFVDSGGRTYYPHILRIGSARNKKNNEIEMVQSVSLEESVEALLLDELDECVVALRRKLQDNIAKIVHLQSLLLNLKLFFGKFPLNEGWELRVSVENAQPYWVDHVKKCTTSQPPLFDSNRKLTYSAFHELPEYKSFSLSFVQLLEEFRVSSLRLARMRSIIRHRAEFGTRKMSELRQTLESSFIEEADIVFSTMNSAGKVIDIHLNQTTMTSLFFCRSSLFGRILLSCGLV